MNPTSIHEDTGLISGLSGLRIWRAMSYGVGCRLGLDPTLLWLWRRPVAVALIRPLAWELSYVMGAALKKKKKSFSFLSYPI